MVGHYLDLAKRNVSKASSAKQPCPYCSRLTIPPPSQQISHAPMAFQGLFGSWWMFFDSAYLMQEDNCAVAQQKLSFYYLKGWVCPGVWRKVEGAVVCACPVGLVVRHRVQGTKLGTVTPILPVGRGHYSQGSWPFFCFRGWNLIDSLQKRLREYQHFCGIFGQEKEMELTGGHDLPANLVKCLSKTLCGPRESLSRALSEKSGRYVLPQRYIYKPS